VRTLLWRAINLTPVCLIDANALTGFCFGTLPGGTYSNWTVPFAAVSSNMLTFVAVTRWFGATSSENYFGTLAYARMPGRVPGDSAGFVWRAAEGDFTVGVRFDRQVVGTSCSASETACCGTRARGTGYCP